MSLCVCWCGKMISQSDLQCEVIMHYLNVHEKLLSMKITQNSMCSHTSTALLLLAPAGSSTYLIRYQ